MKFSVIGVFSLHPHTNINSVTWEKQSFLQVTLRCAAINPAVSGNSPFGGLLVSTNHANLCR
jgi:hypothetical protein